MRGAVMGSLQLDEEPVSCGRAPAQDRNDTSSEVGLVCQARNRWIRRLPNCCPPEELICSDPAGSREVA